MSDVFHQPSLRSCTWLIAILITCAITAGCAQAQDASQDSNKDCHTKFSLLNARRRCEKDEPPKKQEYDLLVNALLWRIQEWKNIGDITHVTVYFRDLENGPIFGIDEQEKFAPASLLKVPIMIALLKYTESHPDALDQEVGIGNSIPEAQNLTDPNQTILPNETYTVQEVMRRMIVYSDNVSKELLRQHLESISPGILDQTFIDLGIALQNPDGTPYLTVKSYASLFRSLYNASYLDREMSQKALKLLSESTFTQGIVAGAPPGTIIAHKFGFLDASPTERQLHDCGIFFDPRTPYLLCIMTRGKSPDVIMSIVSKISKMVSDDVALHDVKN